MKRPNTIALADDRRARVPFAVIAALLLLSSATVIYWLQQTSEPETVREPSQAVTETKSAVKSAMKEAARESLEKAGEKPVTTTEGVDNAASRALANGDTFERYVKLRYYLNLQKRIQRIERQQSRLRGANVTIEIGLPPARYKERNVTDAIDRVDITRSDKGSDTAVEYVSFNVSKQPITVYEDGEQVSQGTIDMNTTTESAVFDLHEQTEDFQASFSETKSKMWGTLAGVIYAKHIPERILAPNWYEERFFEKLITDLEMREYANLLIYDSMRDVYGTTPDTNAPEVAGGCLGLYYTSRFAAAASPVDVFAPEALCTMLKSKAQTGSDFPTGDSISEDFQQQMVNRSRNQVTTGQSGNTLTESEFDSRVETAQENNFTFSRDRVARLAFQNVTGRTLDMSGMDGSDIESQRNRIDQRRAQNTTVNEFDIDDDPPNSPPFGNGSFDDEVRDVINATYTIRTSVNQSWRSNGYVSPSADNYTVINNETVNVRYNNSADTREASIEVDIREENKTQNSTNTTIRNDVVFNTTLEVGANDPNITVANHGIKYPYGDPTGGSSQPTFAGGLWYLWWGGSVANQVNPDWDAIEQNISDELNASNVTSVGEFENELNTVLRSSDSVRAYKPATDSRDSFQSWLMDDLNDTIDRTANVTVKANTTEYLDNDSDTFDKLLINDSEAQNLTYNGTMEDGQYREPADRARAELRKRWVETVNWYINRTQERKQNRIEKINSEMESQAGPDTLQESYKSAKDNASNPFSIDGGSGNIINGSSHSDSKYQVNANPDWLSHVPSSPGSVEGATAKDEIREDSEGVHYTGLSMRRIYPAPNPGIPVIIPFPPFWILSINAGSYEVNGQYARFSVKPNAPENHVANTSYVRQAQPVSLSFNGVRRNVGRVEPIAFDWEMGLPLVTVGGGVLKKGSKGIGDYPLVDLNPFLDCTPTFPEVGTAPREPTKTNAECADAGVYGDIAGGLLQPGRAYLGEKATDFVKRIRPGKFSGRSWGDSVNTEALLTPLENVKSWPARAISKKARWGIAGRRASSNPEIRELKQRVEDWDVKIQQNREFKRDALWNDANTRELRSIDATGESWKRTRGELQTNLDLDYKGLRMDRYLDVTRDQNKLPDAINPEKNTGLTVTASRLADVATAVALRKGSYDGAECPAVDRDTTKGCDDEQLEVEVYPDDDGHVVAIESEIQHTSRDKTLFVQTRSVGSDPYFQGSSSLARLVDGNIDYSADKTSNTNLASLHRIRGTYRFTDQNISGDKDVSHAQEVLLGYTNVTVIEAADDETAPMLRVNYDGYTFLIALAENGADWDHFRSKLTTDDYRAETVNVFIGTEAAQRELGDRLSPRSSVVLSDDGTPQYTCGDSTQAIYNGTDSDKMFKFRVDEENRLFGPGETPDTFC